MEEKSPFFCLHKMPIKVAEICILESQTSITQKDLSTPKTGKAKNWVFLEVIDVVNLLYPNSSFTDS